MKEKGFTLIELMVAMVIISVLAMIAIPSYQNSIRRSHRSDATNALFNVGNDQEKFFMQNNAYATSIAQLATYDPHVSSTENKWYTLAISATSNGGYTAVATASGGTQLADTQCKKFFFTNDGSKTAQDATGTDTTSTCWQ